MSKVANGADALFEVFKRWGIRRVFTCPGSTEAAFLNGSLSHPEIDVILTTHESVAVSMADGLSRVTREPSVAYLHANVGLANGIAHLYAAHIARSPVVVINGLKPRSIANRAAFTTAHDTRDFVRQYVKWDWEVLRREAIAEDINRAFKISTTSPRGPTWVGIAQDLLESRGEITVPDRDRYIVRSNVRPGPTAIEEAARMLGDAKRPLLVAGDDVARAEASDEMVALSERLGAPVVAEDRWSLESLSFPTDHPNYLGTYRPGSYVVTQADAIFFAGARAFTEFEPSGSPAIPPSARVIHLHSDAREIAKIYGVDVSLVGDAQVTLNDLLFRLESTGVASAATSEYLRAAREEREQQKGQRIGLHPSEEGPIQVPALVDSLLELSDEQTIIVDDSTTSRTALLDAFNGKRLRPLYTSSSGSLGWAMGAALGIKLGAPGQPVVAFVGDGVFQFGLPALWAAEHYGIAVTYVVVNNQSYAAVGAALERYLGRTLSPAQFPVMDISGPKIASISEGFGVHGIRIDRLSDFKPAFERARDREGPTVIEVMTDTTVLGPPYRPLAKGREGAG
jgi:benzoylformate decarboxylase